MPTKNQTESGLFDSIISPENDIQRDENNSDDDGPERRTMNQRRGAFGRNFRRAVDETVQRGDGLRLRHEADDNRHDHADDPGPQRAVHVRGDGAGVAGKRDVLHRGGIHFNPDEHRSGGDGARQKAPEASLARGAFPEHAEEDRAEQRRDEYAEQGLHVIHDAQKLHHEIGGADADEDSEYRAPAAHGDVMRVGCIFANEGAVDVVGPDRGEGADVAGHAGHETGDEGRDAEAQEARAAIAREHQRQNLIVAVAGGASDACAREFEGEDGESEQARKDYDEGHNHLECRADDRRHFRGTQILGGEEALDDKKIRGPVAEGKNKALAEEDTGPVDALGVRIEMAEITPEMDVFDRGVVNDLSLERVPAAGFDEAENRNQECASPDEHELENFIENGRAQAAERDVNSHGERGDPDAEVHVPAEDNFEHEGHGIHVDATHEDGHEAEGDGGKGAAGFVVTQFEIAGDGVRLRNVVERHHEDAEEEHGGDGGDPVGVRGEDAVLVRRGGPAHQLESAEIGGEEAEAGDPGRHLAAS